MMITRFWIGGIWSLATGLIGGWLVLHPWMFAIQSGVGWTNATKSEVGTGLFLILIALIGIAVLVRDVLATMRSAGLIRPRRPRPRPVPATVPRPAAPQGVDMEVTVSRLAQLLAEELAHEQRSGSDQEPASMRR